jgi:hypothetical protein
VFYHWHGDTFENERVEFPDDGTLRSDFRSRQADGLWGEDIVPADTPRGSADVTGASCRASKARWIAGLGNDECGGQLSYLFVIAQLLLSTHRTV